MPEETAVQVLDFAKFLRSKHASAQPERTANLTVPEIKDAYGIFKDLKGMDTTIERDEEIIGKRKLFNLLEEGLEDIKNGDVLSEKEMDNFLDLI